MEQYKKTLRLRIRIMGLSYFGFTLFLIYDQFFAPVQKEVNIMAEFQKGLLVGLAVVLMFLVSKYQKALRDDAALKKLYLKAKDERKKAIMDASGGYVLPACSVIIMIAGIVGGYYDKVIFYSLIGCGYFLLTIKGILKIYYMKKY